MDKIRMVIISADTSTKKGLAAIFESEKLFEVIGSFSLRDAREKLVLMQPDAILLDTGGNVSEYIEQISHLKNGCPCSFFIALVEDDYSDESFSLLLHGVDSCVPRGLMRWCLLKTVELVCRAGLFCMPGSFRKMVSFEKGIKKHNYINGSSSDGKALTRREMEILQLMAGNQSNKEIAAKLFISELTVKTHVSHILRKLGQSNRAQAIIYSYKVGLVRDSVVGYK